MKNISQSSTGKYQIMAEINMVPFIDVVLVVLIIFMVMTPFLAQSKIKMSLPPAETGEADKNDEQRIEVQVGKTGEIAINGMIVTMAELEKMLKQTILDPAEDAVIIQADKDVPFEQFLAVVDVARKIGVARFGISVKPLKATGKQPAPKPAARKTTNSKPAIQKKPAQP